MPEVRELVDELDEVALVYPWQHPNPRVDRLCQEVLAAVREGQKCGESRREIFSRVWELARSACELGALDGLQLARLEQAPSRIEVPYMTEPWYC